MWKMYGSSGQYEQDTNFSKHTGEIFLLESIAATAIIDYTKPYLEIRNHILISRVFVGA